MEHVLPGDGTDNLDDLHDALADSDFLEVTFGSLSDEKPGILKVDAVIDVNDPRLTNVAYWESGPDGGWFSLEGRPYHVPGEGPEEAHILGLPDDLSEDDRLLLNHAAQQLREIHELAGQVLEDGYSLVRKAAYATLDALAEEALEYEDDEEDEGEPLEPWEELLQEFTRQCRMGLFGGLSVDESTELSGVVNVSAFVLDLDGDEPLELKVYWQAEEGSDTPSHWIAAGNTAVKETHTGAKAFYDELLASHEGEGRGHLEHAILHLHELAHIASDIIMMKAKRPYEVIAEAQLDEPPSDAAMEAMSATEVSDALAGLNGIARLYTGSRPLDISQGHRPQD
ncbi:hypothetical protein KIH31_00090 [Paenarthrobacter sp. DKR-5]|uniref:hypothetical protein n=1 Tax=Paenarthrobacter sp. DKR-5 TaxID=2835535 RepID=UPI001BDCE928|nr:hypothetical protein [Paenarthrobacter sp. DKR-5]MBT1000989.1 hypothetical protein [Paenarthrobacter sp. DKR-5]